MFNSDAHIVKLKKTCLKYLEIIDCWFEKEKCENISGTPTWKIKGEYYKGVQSIKKLQELTGC